MVTDTRRLNQDFPGEFPKGANVADLSAFAGSPSDKEAKVFRRLRPGILVSWPFVAA